ncbi:hypothetical protein SLNSH_17385 [Alsobacter soli]|uniref:Acyltransferase 3 domain-containing protein n=1 Tax=Alsobacter soli TaxID=2109933 RepID=A0A2T1HQ19_9HYPH|nr:acyltransferase [Alsobacter soli]PSC03717.1 hypothetical protein SLNSH_17385 [Alsobacter soli]
MGPGVRSPWRWDVDGFFVVSGLSLAVASAHADFTRWRDWSAFFIRRLFRIWPLYAVATLIAAALLIHNGAPFGAGLGKLVLVNLTLAFGWLDPSKAIPVGGWSLAVEVAFYMLFPASMLTVRLGRWSLPVLAAAATFAMLVGAAHLDRNGSLTPQWADYVRLRQHAAFFVCGMALGLSATPLSRLPRPASVALVAVGGLTFFATALAFGGSDAVSLVQPAPRFCFLVALTLMAAGACRRESAGVLERVAELLGQASYPVYLIHPLAYESLRLFVEPGWAGSLALTPAVIVLSIVIHRRLEIPVILRGAKLAKAVAQPRGGMGAAMTGSPAGSARSGASRIRSRAIETR